MANFFEKLFKIEIIKVKAAEYVDAAVKFVEEAATSEKGIEKKQMAIDWLLDKVKVPVLIRVFFKDAIAKLLDTLIEQAVARMKEAANKIKEA